jgi:hypothetical protein
MPIHHIIELELGLDLLDLLYLYKALDDHNHIYLLISRHRLGDIITLHHLVVRLHFSSQ